MKAIDLKWGLVGMTILLSLVNLRAQQKTDQELLIGKWRSTEDSKWIMTFTEDGKCYWDYVANNANVHEVYTYKLSRAKSDNGVIFDELTLTDTRDKNYVIEYTFSAGEKNLQLEYSSPTVGTAFFERIEESKVKSQ